jgi:drug/metabolite transporter (DMT)-like permease
MTVHRGDLGRPTRHNIVRLIALALIWGSSFLWIKLALGGLLPTQIAFARIFLGAAVLLFIVKARRLRLPALGSTWGHLIVAAVVTNVIPYTLFAIGEQGIGSGLAGAMNATTPLWTLGIGMLTRTERQVSVTRIAGLLLGFVGVVIILAPWHDRTGSLSGEIECLAATAGYGAGYVYQARFLTSARLSPLVLSCAQLVAAAIVTTLILPVGGTAEPRITPGVAIGILVLGVLGTGAAYVLNYRLIIDAGPMVASTVAYLLPIVAIALGVVFLGESLSWSLIAGTAVVLSGFVIAQGLPSALRLRLPVEGAIQDA